MKPELGDEEFCHEFSTKLLHLGQISHTDTALRWSLFLKKHHLIPESVGACGRTI